MSVTPFIIDEKTKKKLLEIKTYSHANPYSITALEGMRDGSITVAGDMPEHSAFLPFGWKVVFSVNEYPEIGLSRQMSVSINKKKALPNPHIVEILMAMLGFKKELHDCHVAFENCGSGVEAINVVEPIASTL